MTKTKHLRWLEERLWSAQSDLTEIISTPRRLLRPLESWEVDRAFQLGELVAAIRKNIENERQRIGIAAAQRRLERARALVAAVDALEDDAPEDGVEVAPRKRTNWFPKRSWRHLPSTPVVVEPPVPITECDQAPEDGAVIVSEDIDRRANAMVANGYHAMRRKSSRRYEGFR